MHAVRGDLLDRVAAALKRQQRVDGHNERVAHAAGRDRHVDRRLVEVADLGWIRRDGVDCDVDGLPFWPGVATELT